VISNLTFVALGAIKHLRVLVKIWAKVHRIRLLGHSSKNEMTFTKPDELCS